VAVSVSIEVVGAKPLLDHERVHRPLGQQDRPEHRLLGLDVMRRRERLRDLQLGARGDLGRRAHLPSEGTVAGFGAAP
jgi:hypothetical protein